MRGGVASTRPSASTCLTVSLIGVPGAAAPWRSGGFNRAGDEIRGGERPRRVVDEHDVRRGGCERLEAGEHALLARRAADRGGPERAPPRFGVRCAIASS